jgi:putative endonuclease
MRYLQRQGYTVAARNYRPRSGSGEVDLIAWEGNVLAFVEVKTRVDTESGTPDRAVHAQKQQALARVAREYVSRVKTPYERVRFDVITVVETKPPEITLFRDAFKPFY